MVKVEISELAVAIHYDVVVNDREEDFLTDRSMLHYTQVQVKYDTQELYRKGKAVKRVARIRRGEYRACGDSLHADWLIQSRSRHLVAGQVSGTETSAPHDWLVGPSKLVALRDAVLVARNLFQLRQLERTVPVEIYNPSDDPVQLYSKTTLVIWTPIEAITDS